MTDLAMPWFSLDNHVFSQIGENIIGDAPTADEAENLVYCANRLHELRQNPSLNAYDSLCSLFLLKIMDKSITPQADTMGGE